MNIAPIPAFSDNYIWMLERDGRVAVVDPGDANPVLAVLTERGVTLDTIIITHHHFDHTGGVRALKAATNCRVVGPTTQIEGIDEKLVDGDVAHVLGYDFDVLEVPGHTLDHIALHCDDESVLFCGDTLFVGGCGRVFEGTFPMMQSSLAKLAALPLRQPFIALTNIRWPISLLRAKWSRGMNTFWHTLKNASRCVQREFQRCLLLLAESSISILSFGGIHLQWRPS